MVQNITLIAQNSIARWVRSRGLRECQQPNLDALTEMVDMCKQSGSI